MFSVVFRRIVLVLGSFHLSVMAALGIWLWSDPRGFGTADTLDLASITILGKSVPLALTKLRGWSIGIYSLFLAPGLNLVLPMALFLGTFIGYQKLNDRRRSQNGRSSPALPSLAPPSGIRAWYERLPVSPSIVPTVAGMVLLFAINLIFLIDVELTLHRNHHRQISGESVWTFGQILAMILLVLPLRDLMETMLARREKQRIDELARLEKERREELAHREKQRKDQLTVHLRNAIQEKATTETLRELVTNGADVNVEAKGAVVTHVMKVY
jgi:hypothetical protein